MTSKRHPIKSKKKQIPLKNQRSIKLYFKTISFKNCKRDRPSSKRSRLQQTDIRAFFTQRDTQSIMEDESKKKQIPLKNQTSIKLYFKPVPFKNYTRKRPSPKRPQLGQMDIRAFFTQRDMRSVMEGEVRN
ncbi:hypothetical protein MBANPS3_000897 [Mucor bainieri]